MFSHKMSATEMCNAWSGRKPSILSSWLHLIHYQFYHFYFIINIIVVLLLLLQSIQQKQQHHYYQHHQQGGLIIRSGMHGSNWATKIYIMDKWETLTRLMKNYDDLIGDSGLFIEIEARKPIIIIFPSGWTFIKINIGTSWIICSVCISTRSKSLAIDFSV